ncbi:MAG: FAD-binding oxidoreductase [Candidatus Nitrohelix vancouverensis]|uniref:FAD-binding oxidoreductase n=1 Tax=Candidatus Nitrohelix vancouverensis TaxID=2705534 RepID=A0A7T0C3N3_9BACT|nr:MAG: FAD-binding oxidoreductase [Candidatus Nitrohelix vancouverensis]
MILKTAPTEISAYLKDASNYAEGHATAVAIPESEDDLREFLKTNEEPITISGAGTGLTAGRTPLGGAVLSVEKFDRIGELADACIEVGAAVRLKDLQTRLKGSGYFYPPNPTEALSFLGGNFATNASGSRSYKFGVTRDYVKEAHVFLADGRHALLKRGETIAEPLSLDDGSCITFPKVSYISPKCKNAAGYYMQADMDWLDIFIGSGGTLGITTRMKLQLRPEPVDFFSAILFFEDEESSWELVNAIKAQQNELISPCSLEYFDCNSLKRLKTKYENTPPTAQAALFVEQDLYKDTNSDAITEAWVEFLDENRVDLESSWFAQSNRDVDRFHEFRHTLPQLLNEEISRKGWVKMGTDLATSDQHFLELMNFYKRSLSQQTIDFVMFGHIGDNHLHINLFPKSGGSQKEEIMTLYHSLVDQVLEWDGTISAEHGIGKLKKEFLRQMVGDAGLADMRKVKAELDPKGLLGQGAIF